MRFEEFQAVMAFVGAAYPRQALTPATFGVFREFLEHQPYEDVMAQVRAHVAASAFPPAVSELIPPRRAIDRPSRYYQPERLALPPTRDWGREMRLALAPPPDERTDEEAADA